jgi:hypothetical protein
LLEQGPIVFEGLSEMLGSVGGADAAPGDEVGAGGNGGGGVDLQQGQSLHDLDQIGGSGRIEELGADCNAPRLDEIEMVGLHDRRLYGLPGRGLSSFIPGARQV